MSTPRYLHILLVEDHRASAESLAEMLRCLGHAVTLAGSLSSARAALLTARHDGSEIDAALVDICLPDGKGGELMGDLAALGVRGISMSARPDVSEVARLSVGAGFEAHLEKPFTTQSAQRLLQREAAAA